MFDIEKIKEVSKRMRINILKLTHKSGDKGAHVGPSLSIVDLLAVLYQYKMKYNTENPLWEDRDRFILSKGHGGLAYYAVLHESGFFGFDDLYSFEENGGDFPAQPCMNVLKGIELSSGSLGLGLSIGAGISLASLRENKKYKTFVLMGDGELNEGTVWEAAMMASHFKLKSLVAIIDKNNMQSDGGTKEILCMGDLCLKWKSFGWNVILVNGHDVLEIKSAYDDIEKSQIPSVIIAETVKGKGVSFMESKQEWHHSTLSSKQLDRALIEVENLND